MRSGTHRTPPTVAEKLRLPDGRSYTPPDGVVVRPSPQPPKPPPGPPRPSVGARGSLSIDRIHKELFRIYNDCIRDTNAAFHGEEPEPGDHTHEDQNCRSCTLLPRKDWRCSAGIGWAGTDWCKDATMEYEKVCQVPFVEEDGFFQCENVDEWFVRLNNYFHYKLKFGHGLSRDLYQTAEIRVYCDGWKPNMAPGTGGRIKVVQLPPIITYGPPGHWEQFLDIATFGKVGDLVIKGLRKQYLGKVSKMQHIIDTELLSGATATSLGVDGDNTVPLSERNIIWDVPVKQVVQR